MPYLCRNGEVSFLPQSQVGDRFPLGIVREASYEQLSIELKPGDMIVFYTDGIVDAMNGDYQNYGFERFAESIIRHSTKPPDQMVARLVQEMQEYRNGSNFHDDVTIVVLRIKS
jgi:sigma-B regulation protein RsbU (phosphoserine phosphatase)